MSFRTSVCPNMYECYLLFHFGPYLNSKHIFGSILKFANSVCPAVYLSVCLFVAVKFSFPPHSFFKSKVHIFKTSAMTQGTHSQCSRSNWVINKKVDSVWTDFLLKKLSVCLSVCLFVQPKIHLFVCPSVCSSTRRASKCRRRRLICEYEKF